MIDLKTNSMAVKQPTKKLRVVLSSLCYPVTMARYFWDAFDRHPNCEVTMIGPYFGANIPWGGGMNIDWKYIKVPQIALPTAFAKPNLPLSFVMDHIPDPDNIDLFVQIDAGFHFDRRPPGRVVALVETDPHCLRDHYEVPRQYSDFAFCMQTPYMKPGEHFLPYANDHLSFYPEERPLVHDACLIGLHYEQRDRLVRNLRAKNLNVYYDLGVVFDDYRNKYNESAVALCWSSMDDLPVRVWEAMGMARPLVTNRITDLGNFFVEGEHYLGFSSVEEAEAQVHRLLWDKDLADYIRWNAYRKVMAGHTWDHRIKSMLETMKLDGNL